MEKGSVVVVGGTQGLGRELAQSYADDGHDVVVTGKDQSRAESAASEIGGRTRGIGFDLAEPHGIAEQTRGRGRRRIPRPGCDRPGLNNLREYDIDAGVRLVTMKLVGYAEVIHSLLPRIGDDSSILLFGGRARDRPYPGSTTVTTVNGGVIRLVRTPSSNSRRFASTRSTPASSATARSGVTWRRNGTRHWSTGRRSACLVTDGGVHGRGALSPRETRR